MQSLNYRRGLRRVWFLLACVWAVYAANKVDASYQVEYAIDYYAKSPSLFSDQAARESCEWSRTLHLSLHTEKNFNLGQCIADYRPRPPEWTWLWIILLPPTAGVLAALILVFLIRKVLIWVWDGFKPKQ